MYTNRTHMNWSSLIGIGPLYDSYKQYFAFILNLYMYLLTDYEESLNYSFERKHLEAEAIVSNLNVV